MKISNEEQCESTDIIICGGGPTGTMLSALLGQMSMPTSFWSAMLRYRMIPGPLPCEDAIRLLQRLGLYSQIFTKFGSPAGLFKFIGGVHTDLSRKPFMAMDYNTTEGGTGHVYFVSQMQPVTEQAMREVINECPSSQLRSKSTVTSISADEEMVYVEYSDALATPKRIQAKFLLGADGKTGFTRKMYLEPKGIKMERCLG
jgi:2-polyprenyl-6-methoxyphenol hydroxylase-like FAD-dependent oxidoreductase